MALYTAGRFIEHSYVKSERTGRRWAGQGNASTQLSFPDSDEDGSSRGNNEKKTTKQKRARCLIVACCRSLQCTLKFRRHRISENDYHASHLVSQLF